MEEESRTQAGSSHSALPPWVPAGHPPAGGPNLHLGNPRPHFLGTRSLYTPSYRSLSKKVSYFNQVGTHRITQPPSKSGPNLREFWWPGLLPRVQALSGPERTQESSPLFAKDNTETQGEGARVPPYFARPMPWLSRANPDCGAKGRGQPVLVEMTPTFSLTEAIHERRESNRE